jgi:F1F0 ATPase subunit 2
MNVDGLAIAISGVAGAAAGLAFFGGLYVTTRRIASARHPALLMIGSFFARSALVLAAAWLAARSAGHWGVVALLAGIIFARLAMVGLVRHAEPAEES